MEQRQALGTRLVGAITVALVLFLVLVVVTPLDAAISSISPGSGSVTAGQSFTVTVNLSGSDTCLGATSSSGLIAVSVAPICGGTGPWSASATLSPNYDTPGGQYTITFTETPQAGGSPDVATFTLTVAAAPPTTTTTTVPEGTTTTTDPNAPTTTTTAPAPTTTTTQATSTTTAPTTTAGSTTTTKPPTTTVALPGPTTTVASTTTTTLDRSPASSSIPTTTSSQPPNELALGNEVDGDPGQEAPSAAGPGVGPPSAPGDGPTGTDPGRSGIVAALDQPPLPPATIKSTLSLSLRGLAEAIPQSLKDLVVSPFVIIGVVLGAIRDTGAATIWPLLIVIPLIIDWRGFRERFNPNMGVEVS